MRRKKPRN